MLELDELLDWDEPEEDEPEEESPPDDELLDSPDFSAATELEPERESVR